MVITGDRSVPDHAEARISRLEPQAVNAAAEWVKRRLAHSADVLHPGPGSGQAHVKRHPLTGLPVSRRRRNPRRPWTTWVEATAPRD